MSLWQGDQHHVTGCSFSLAAAAASGDRTWSSAPISAEQQWTLSCWMRQHHQEQHVGWDSMTLDAD